MLEKLLPKEIYEAVVKNADPKTVTEIRLRLGLPLCFHDGVKWQHLNKNGGYIVSQSDIDSVIGRASNYSLYSVNESIINGYIPYRGGIRVGIAGEGVTENGKLLTVKDIAFVAIRLPRQLVGLTDKLAYNFKESESFLIISPPGGGKTTLLREMVKKISDSGANCMLIDERMEVSGISCGKRYFDVGQNTDIVSAIGKTHSMENIIRAMRPDFVFTDEIFKEEETDSLLDAIRSGIKIGATIHGRDIKKVVDDKRYKRLFDVVNYVILLTDKPVGKVLFDGRISQDTYA